MFDVFSGKNCLNDEDCKKLEICSNSTCQCDEGYVEYIEKCFASTNIIIIIIILIMYVNDDDDDNINK